MSSSKANGEYYFVPLGRDPGGFLDFLGLPPNASEADAKVCENEFRDKLEVEFRSKSYRLAIQMEYQNLKEKQRKSEKKEDELSSEIEKLKGKYISFNAKLLKLSVRLQEKAITQETHDSELERLQTEFDELIVESDTSPITTPYFLLT